MRVSGAGPVGVRRGVRGFRLGLRDGGDGRRVTPAREAVLQGHGAPQPPADCAGCGGHRRKHRGVCIKGADGVQLRDSQGLLAAGHRGAHRLCPQSIVPPRRSRAAGAGFMDRLASKIQLITSYLQRTDYGCLVYQVAFAREEVQELQKNPERFLQESLNLVGYTGALANPLVAPEESLTRINGSIIQKFYHVILLLLYHI